jgi:glucan phosphoethanolaminetransferase (alkaline phosphatase superfamily)
MRFLLRPANLYLLVSYLALSAVPFAPWLFGRVVEQPGQVIAVEFLCWTAAWAVFGRPARFHWLLLPAFLALPVELYLFAFYGQGISSHHLGIMFETSPAEAMEFLGQKVWLLLAVFVGVLAWWASSWRAAWVTRDLDWKDASRAVVLCVLGISAAVLGYGWSRSSRKQASPLPPANRKPARLRRPRRPNCRRCRTGPACPSTPTALRAPGRSDWPRGVSTSTANAPTWPT